MSDAIASLGKAGTGIVESIQNNNPNSVTNQQGAKLLNLNDMNDAPGGYAPRAGLIAPGVDPTTGAVNSIPSGVSTLGTAPQTFTGGQKALDSAIAIQRSQQQGTGLQSEVDLRKAQTQEANTRSSTMGLNTAINLMKVQNPKQFAPRAPAYDTLESLSRDINTQVPGQVNPDDPTKTIPSSVGILQGLSSGTNNRGRLVKDPSGGNNMVWQGDDNGPLVSFNPSTTAYGATNDQRPSEQAARPYLPFNAATQYAQRYGKISQGGGRFLLPTQAQGGGVQPSPPTSGQPQAQPQSAGGAVRAQSQ
jgi:hypothetical protein